MEAYVELYAKDEVDNGTETPLIADLSEETPQKVDEHKFRWLGVGRYSKEAKSTIQIVGELTMASLSSSPR